MAQRGRKRVEIDWEEFEALCAIQATLEEMAMVLKCSERTIERACQRHYKMNFVSIFAQKRRRGHISLRRRIWTAALNGNVALLIFLAKQYLGMADQVRVTLPGQPAFNDQRDISRLSDEQLIQYQIFNAITEGLDPALAAKQLAAALAKLPKLPKETPGAEGGSPGADKPADQRGDGEKTPPPVRPVN